MMHHDVASRDIFRHWRIPATTVCQSCYGQCTRQEYGPVELTVAAGETIARSATVDILTKPCPLCYGAGIVPTRLPIRVTVFQNGKIIGTATGPELRLRDVRSVFVDMRRDDYQPQVRDGELTWNASRHLGPGDIEALDGFVWEKEGS